MPITRTIRADSEQPDPKVIAEGARILRGGGLVAFATETVYGLGADATNPDAVAKIFEAKGRPATNPLIVHVHDKAAARRCVAHWPERAEILADRFWPGPLTLVLPRLEIIPDIVTAGQETVGVRVPALGVARWLILEAGRPIAATISTARST
jgi:L-threonylcarbamoyladenylate synthase